MQLFVAVLGSSELDDPAKDESASGFLARLRSVVPRQVVSSPPLAWRSPRGRALAMYWGPQDEDSAHARLDSEGAVYALGTWSDRPVNLAEALARGSGAGVVSLVGIKDDTVTIRSSRSGVEALYVASSRSRMAVSNRAAVACLAVHHNRLVYDLKALPQFASAGFALSSATPFDGVEALPRNARVEIRRRAFWKGFTTRVHAPSQHATEEPASIDLVAPALAESLVQAMAPVGQLASVVPVELSLTGGKDSRLIAAAMKAAGVEFTTQTFGMASHPDVVVGKQVAAHLGVPHKHNAPTISKSDSGQGEIAVDPLRRACDAILLGEGMISSYENLGSPSTPFRLSGVISGQGGELLRGGYAHYAPETSPEGAAAFLRKGFLRNKAVMQPDAWSELEALITPWAEEALMRPLAVLDDFYRDFRVGRWAATARTAYRSTRNLVQPLFDSEVVKHSELSPVGARADESLLYLTLRALSPPLAEMPFAEQRWFFERDAPSELLPYGWGARAPVFALDDGSQPQSRFNWRIGYGESLQSVFRDVILDEARDDDLFAVFDRREVERLVTAVPPRSQHLVWHLFTMSVLLSGAWHEEQVSPRPVTISVP